MKVNEACRDGEQTPDSPESSWSIDAIDALYRVLYVQDSEKQELSEAVLELERQHGPALF